MFQTTHKMRVPLEKEPHKSGKTHNEELVIKVEEEDILGASKESQSGEEEYFCETEGSSITQGQEYSKSFTQEECLTPSKESQSGENEYRETDGSSNSFNEIKSHFAEGEYITYICDIETCSESFARKEDLMLHKQSHYGEGRYFCTAEGCSMSFPQRGTLNRHLKIHSGERPFICDAEGCSKSFKIKISLKRHQKIHSDERAYVCDIEGCSKAYNTSGSLYQHKQTHSGKRPYICDIEACGKSFSQNETLKRHQKIHTGKKEYICAVETCSKPFTQKEHLLRHEMVHSGERPYICDSKGCTKTYTQKIGLIQHQKIHSGYRPYVCDFLRKKKKRGKIVTLVCSKSFTEMSYLNRHKRTVHRCEMPYSCDTCPKIFADYDSLRQHKYKCLQGEEDPLLILEMFEPQSNHQEEMEEKKEGVNDLFSHLPQGHQEEMAEEVDGDINDLFYHMPKYHEDLVTGLDSDWPLAWVKKEAESEKLRQIMTNSRESERHELFLDPQQQELRKCKSYTKLHKMANSKFTHLFGPEMEEDVMMFLEKEVFEKQILQSDTDESLKVMVAQGPHVVFNYVSLVLFPEVFTSWVKSCLLYTSPSPRD